MDEMDDLWSTAVTGRGLVENFPPNRYSKNQIVDYYPQYGTDFIKDVPYNNNPQMQTDYNSRLEEAQFNYDVPGSFQRHQSNRYSSGNQNNYNQNKQFSAANENINYNPKNRYNAVYRNSTYNQNKQFNAVNKRTDSNHNRFNLARNNNNREKVLNVFNRNDDYNQKNGMNSTDIYYNSLEDNISYPNINDYTNRQNSTNTQKIHDNNPLERNNEKYPANYNVRCLQLNSKQTEGRWETGLQDRGHSKRLYERYTEKKFIDRSLQQSVFLKKMYQSNDPVSRRGLGGNFLSGSHKTYKEEFDSQDYNNIPSGENGHFDRGLSVNNDKRFDDQIKYSDWEHGDDSYETNLNRAYYNYNTSDNYDAATTRKNNNGHNIYLDKVKNFHQDEYGQDTLDYRRNNEIQSKRLHREDQFYENFNPKRIKITSRSIENGQKNSRESNRKAAIEEMLLDAGNKAIENHVKTSQISLNKSNMQNLGKLPPRLATAPQIVRFLPLNLQGSPFQSVNVLNQSIPNRLQFIPNLVPVVNPLTNQIRMPNQLQVVNTLPSHLQNHPILLQNILPTPKQIQQQSPLESHAYPNQENIHASKINVQAATKFKGILPTPVIKTEFLESQVKNPPSFIGGNPSQGLLPTPAALPPPPGPHRLPQFHRLPLPLRLATPILPPHRLPPSHRLLPSHYGRMPLHQGLKQMQQSSLKPAKKNFESKDNNEVVSLSSQSKIPHHTPVPQPVIRVELPKNVFNPAPGLNPNSVLYKPVVIDPTMSQQAYSNAVAEAIKNHNDQVERHNALLMRKVFKQMDTRKKQYERSLIGISRKAQKRQRIFRDEAPWFNEQCRKLYIRKQKAWNRITRHTRKNKPEHAEQARKDFQIVMREYLPLCRKLKEEYYKELASDETDKLQEICKLTIATMIDKVISYGKKPKSDLVKLLNKRHSLSLTEETLYLIPSQAEIDDAKNIAYTPIVYPTVWKAYEIVAMEVLSDLVEGVVLIEEIESNLVAGNEISSETAILSDAEEIDETSVICDVENAFMEDSSIERMSIKLNSVVQSKTVSRETDEKIVENKDLGVKKTPETLKTQVHPN